jgi:hypothetical protein
LTHQTCEPFKPINSEQITLNHVIHSKLSNLNLVCGGASGIANRGRGGLGLLRLLLLLSLLGGNWSRGRSSLFNGLLNQHTEDEL